MFDQLIREYTGTLDLLRDFLDLQQSILKTANRRVRDKTMFAPFVYGLMKSGAKLPIFNPKIGPEVIRKRMPAGVRVLIGKKKNGRASFSIETKGQKGEDFTATMDRFFRELSKPELLNRGTLMNLTSQTEYFFAQLIRTHMLRFKLFDSAEKVLSIDDLKRMNSLSDAEEYLVERRLLKLMYDGLPDWCDHLKSKAGLSMSYLQGDLESLGEVVLRRNLIVHNNGIVNSLYLSRIQNKKNLVVGRKIDVSAEYLRERIDLFEGAISLVGFELWGKLDPSNPKRSDAAISIVDRAMTNGRWNVVEKLASHFIADSIMKEEERLLCQVNHWLSQKRLGRYREIRGSIQKADFSAKAPQYQLARLALLEDYKGFFQLLPLAVKSGYPIETIAAWPLFADVRRSAEFKGTWKRRFEKLASN